MPEIAVACLTIALFARERTHHVSGRTYLCTVDYKGLTGCVFGEKWPRIRQPKTMTGHCPFMFRYGTCRLHLSFLLLQLHRDVHQKVGQGEGCPPQPARHIGATTVQRYIFSPKPTKMCTFICFSKYNNPLQTPVIMNIKIDTNFRFSVASMQYLPNGELSITLVSDASPADAHYRPGGCSMLCRWSG